MYDVIIIGAGPAGASAALFTARAEKKTLVIDNGKSILKPAWVENHYGIIDGITGPELYELGKKQAIKAGAELINDSVLDVTSENDMYTVKTDHNDYQSKHIIFATGNSTELAEQVGLDVIPGTEPKIKSVIKVDHDGKTNKKGIYAVGTVAGLTVHTTVVAGHGVQVAVNLLSELKGSRYVDHDINK
ncbi:FAD-dependent oxidoreductase [Haloplasma contractile]|uniref:Thioredoxin reductase protein n=1 Tax=Haloplasma contractile SSD-17B TaxID=1033810 RepID=U2EDW1_9MOLU|nr:FAD-dependent oxidoreductase [Haloplasma contractile]ERJ13178.1 thioredoxin reductase protein [Haloplasma contractile SSD-17B]